MIWDKLSRLMILGHLMVIKWQEQTFFRASLMGYNSRVGMGHILESKGPHICWSKFSINHQLCVPQFGSIPIILIILGYWYMIYNTNIYIYIYTHNGCKTSILREYLMRYNCLVHSSILWPFSGTYHDRPVDLGQTPWSYTLLVFLLLFFICYLIYVYVLYQCIYIYTYINLSIHHMNMY